MLSGAFRRFPLLYFNRLILQSLWILNSLKASINKIGFQGLRSPAGKCTSIPLILNKKKSDGIYCHLRLQTAFTVIDNSLGWMVAGIILGTCRRIIWRVEVWKLSCMCFLLSKNPHTFAQGTFYQVIFSRLWHYFQHKNCIPRSLDARFPLNERKICTIS